MSYTDDVREFLLKFNRPVLDEPQLPDMEVQQASFKMVDEEFDELAKAWEDGNLVELADAIGDLIYVLCQMALFYGIPLDAVWDEVHRANMRKVGGAKRDDGKILKPEGWIPPDISGVLFGRGAGHLSPDEGSDVPRGDE